MLGSWVRAPRGPLTKILTMAILSGFFVSGRGDSLLPSVRKTLRSEALFYRTLQKNGARQTDNDAFAVRRHTATDPPA